MVTEKSPLETLHLLSSPLTVGAEAMVPIFHTIRVIAVIVAVLVISWAFHFRGGLALVSDNKDLIFNDNIRNKKLQTISSPLVAVCCVLTGVWAALKFNNDKGIDKFLQHPFLVGPCLPFSLCRSVDDRLWDIHGYPGGSKTSREKSLPWRAFCGVDIYSLAVATASTGLLEKVTFLQTNKSGISAFLKYEKWTKP